MIDPLLDTLDAMIQTTEQLASLTQRERSAIVGGHTDDLATCSMEKEGLLGRLSCFNERLEEEVVSAWVWLGTDGSLAGDGRARLADIVGRVSEPHKSRLVSALQKLRALAKATKVANQANGLLSEAAQQRMEGLSGFLRGMFSTQSVYQATGRWKGAAVNGRTLGRG
jgi:flagellar biosynthesis/type III secretory pathway chaperone